METMLGMELADKIDIEAARKVLEQVDIAIQRMMDETDAIWAEQGFKASESARADRETFRMTARYLRTVIGD